MGKYRADGLPTKAHLHAMLSTGMAYPGPTETKFVDKTGRIFYATAAGNLRQVTAKRSTSAGRKYRADGLPTKQHLRAMLSAGMAYPGRTETKFFNKQGRVFYATAAGELRKLSL